MADIGKPQRVEEESKEDKGLVAATELIPKPTKDPNDPLVCLDAPGIFDQKLILSRIGVNSRSIQHISPSVALPSWPRSTRVTSLLLSLFWQSNFIRIQPKPAS